MLGANLAGRDPVTGESPSEHYMSLQRFLRLGPSPSLVQVRQFLWDELGLKGLFSGDGFTYDDHGERGSEEFLACNKRLREIQGASVVQVSAVREMCAALPTFQRPIKRLLTTTPVMK